MLFLPLLYLFIALTIRALFLAVSYSENRTQFGPKDQPEVSIMTHTTHQRRLIPAIARTYAGDFALKYISKRFATHNSSAANELKVIHAHASGIKSVVAWYVCFVQPRR